MVSLEFFIDIIPPATLCPWGWLSLWQKRVPRIFYLGEGRGGGWKRPVQVTDNLTTFMCRLSWNLGASASWNPEGLCRPVTGLLYRSLYFVGGVAIRVAYVENKRKSVHARFCWCSWCPVVCLCEYSNYSSVYIINRQFFLQVLKLGKEFHSVNYVKKQSLYRPGVAQRVPGS
jgi:hypothetical protein